ncbi:aminotransferase class IV [Planctomycetota bacterium]
MEMAMIQDQLIPYDQLEPIYLDRALYFGDGVYEVIRSYGGRIFALDEHLERFAQSLGAVAIEGVDINVVRQRVIAGYARAEIADAKIYFHVTRGSAARDLVGDSSAGPNFFMTIQTLPDDRASKEQGIAVATAPDWRWKRCDIKSLNLLANVLARQKAEEQGAQEAILVDEDGLITEGAGSAFFMVVQEAGDTILCTTPLTANILPSVTRRYVLQAACACEMPVHEVSYTPQQARTAREMFIAVTTKDIVPVVCFDGQTIGEGLPGPWTRKLMAAFDSLTSIRTGC